MNITIASIGKTKSDSLRSVEDQYEKRISGRMRCSRQYVKNEKELIQLVSQFSGTVIACDERGMQMTSSEFASFMDRLSQETHNVLFCIGDAEGLPEVIIEQAQSQLALSQMTLPHDLARTVLLEQLYRAYTILQGHPYHK